VKSIFRYHYQIKVTQFMSFKHLFLAVAVAAISTFSEASVTLRFGQTAVARATGFADHLGTIQNGMSWGIIVDASGNGFADGSYNVFDSSVSGFLSATGPSAAIAADDYFVASGLVTTSASATGGDLAVTAGAITLLSGIFPTYPLNVGSGDAFKIVWFESTPAASSYYGTLGTGLFTLPADGSDTSYASFFVGNDPVKAANLQFPGAGPVPEPSRMMLLGFGLVGLFFRRRR
jgi:hypothetical protein